MEVPVDDLIGWLRSRNLIHSDSAEELVEIKEKYSSFVSLLNESEVRTGDIADFAESSVKWPSSISFPALLTLQEKLRNDNALDVGDAVLGKLSEAIDAYTHKGAHIAEAAFALVRSVKTEKSSIEEEIHLHRKLTDEFIARKEAAENRLLTLKGTEEIDDIMKNDVEERLSQRYGEFFDDKNNEKNLISLVEMAKTNISRSYNFTSILLASKVSRGEFLLKNWPKITEELVELETVLLRVLAGVGGRDVVTKSLGREKISKFGDGSDVDRWAHNLSTFIREMEEIFLIAVPSFEKLRKQEQIALLTEARSLKIAIERASASITEATRRVTELQNESQLISQIANSHQCLVENEVSKILETRVKIANM